MELPLAPTLLIALIVVGHLVQLLWDRDDWPLSNYSMYSYSVHDHANNPFVPLRGDRKADAGVLVLGIALADGTAQPLTTKYAHPLLMPYERLRILRHLTTLFKNGKDLGPAMKRLAEWVHHRNVDKRPITAIVLELYIWHRIPEIPVRHHPPDEIVEIGRHALPS